MVGVVVVGYVENLVLTLERDSLVTDALDELIDDFGTQLHLADNLDQVGGREDPLCAASLQHFFELFGGHSGRQRCGRGIRRSVGVGLPAWSLLSAGCVAWGPPGHQTSRRRSRSQASNHDMASLPSVSSFSNHRRTVAVSRCVSSSPAGEILV